MITPMGTGLGKLLQGLVVLLLAFLVVASSAVAFLLWVSWSVPDGAIGTVARSTAGIAGVALIATARSRIAVGAVTLESLLVTMVVLFALLKMLGSTARGTPFVMANVGRLRLIAAALAVSLVAKSTVPLLVPAPVAAWLALRGWSFNLGDLGALLVAAVLAEVFREGVRLREDVDATV